MNKSQFFTTLLLLLGFLAFYCPVPLTAQDYLTITTWNIETLGGEGRGLAGGYGQGSLGLRSSEQLKKIAELIKNDLGSDILAIQEIAITSTPNGVSSSEGLNAIVAELGQEWSYFLPPVGSIPEGHANLFCAFLWNKSRVNLQKVFMLNVPNHEMAGANLFDRTPLVGYFEAKKDGVGTNDFVLVNVHLKSGQDNDENHLIAMVALEHGLTKNLKDNQVKESDRIILGDFNDNPYAKKANGKPQYSDALYRHMEFKKYDDLVTQDFHSTRMDGELSSIIDHILVNKSAKLHIPANKAIIYLPGDSSTFADWRKTYSDHFPISFKLAIENQDDDVDF
jgi:endonuclease/exonuclease/phosphatase family metal-dependent hydrolase